MLAAVVALASTPARAWEPATTHAGLTESAAIASSLHRILARRYARPLGLFEPLRLHPELLAAGVGRSVTVRLGTLDPAGGYRPGDDQIQSALAWLTAGSVLAKTPPERGRHHFYDPSRDRGLDDAGTGGGAGFLQAVRVALDGGSSLRGLATGTSFDLRGMASPTWIESPQNDLGLQAFLAALERAVSGASADDREGALVEALLAAGAILAVVEDAGEPAHVRNDFRGAFLGTAGGGPFDRSAAFERFVADSYGRAGVPHAAAPVHRPTLRAFITGADAQGLADRTQRRFFSDGTLPEDVVVDRDTSARDVLVEARQSLPYGLPELPPRLELATPERTRYVRVEGRRALAYRRVRGRIRFFLDEAVYADAARALLPETAAYAAGAIDHLLRGELNLRPVDGAVEVVTSAALHAGRVRVFAEDAAGMRRPIGESAVGGASGSAVLARLSVPGGTRRVAAVFRGEDAAGPVVASGEIAWPAVAPSAAR